MKGTQPRTFGLALGRLRLCVLACSWIFAISLTLQILIWGMVTATDWHYTEIKGQPPETLVISPSDRARELRDRRGSDGKKAGVVAVPNKVPSALYIFFEDFSGVAAAVGTMALVVLVPLVMVGIILVAGTASPSVDKSISALIWTMIVIVLTLPVGAALNLPWTHGAFYDYDALMATLDAQNHGAVIGFKFYARYLVLPGACIAGTILLTWRFNAGIESVIEKRAWQLDAELEKEAGNIKITSLHGGRAGSALTKAVRKNGDGAEEAAPAKPAAMPSARAVSPGIAPKRII